MCKISLVSVTVPFKYSKTKGMGAILFLYKQTEDDHTSLLLEETVISPPREDLKNVTFLLIIMIKKFSFPEAFLSKPSYP